MTSPQGQDSGPSRSLNPRRVITYETTTGKHIFTEEGNNEAWIVTDVITEPVP